MGRQVRAPDGWVIDQVEDDDEPLYFLYRHGSLIGPDGYTREALRQALDQYGMSLGDFEEAGPDRE